MNLSKAKEIALARMTGKLPLSVRNRILRKAHGRDSQRRQFYLKRIAKMNEAERELSDRVFNAPAK